MASSSPKTPTQSSAHLDGKSARPQTPDRPVVHVSDHLRAIQLQKKKDEALKKERVKKLTVPKARGPSLAYNPMDVEDPVPQKVRSRVPALRDSLASFVTENRKREREVSGSSVESVVLKHVKHRKAGGDPSTFEAEYFARVKARVRARISLVEFQLECRRKDLEHLNQARDDKTVSHRTYRKTLEAIEGQISHMRHEIIILESRAGLIAGRVLDHHRTLADLADTNSVTDAHVSSIIQTYMIDAAGQTCRAQAKGASGRGKEQALFRNNLIGYYGSRKQSKKQKLEDPCAADDEVEYWCPISHKHFSGRRMRAAHIVLFAVGEMNCTYIFGKSDDDDRGHLFNPKNGLFIHEDLERAFDRAQIAVVPAGNGSTDLKVVVFDKSILSGDREDPLPWSELSDRPLIFKNDHRPRLRYLYFTFLMNVFRRQRGECEGWKNDVLPYSHGEAWGSPKQWLRGSTIRMLGRRIGLEPDLEKLLGTNDLPITTEEDEDDKDGRFAALVSEQIHASVQDKLELPTWGVW
ncbi:MAG: hypothetical protein M1815_000487 [Lichina confinis]|nr:MAG: hypothetical protein M1815_000487 [Lichina confinis]